MKKIYLAILSLTLIMSCGKAESSEYENTATQSLYDEESGSYSDGDYCAEVNYYNPNTGTQSSYTLTVEVSNNEVTQINFPNGGYFDDEITDGTLDSSGEASFTSNNGYQYTVEITGSADNCFENVPLAEQCQGITEDGDQCQNVTDNPNGLCWQHEDQE